MKLAIFNGSPRGIKSNTKILLDKFIEGIDTKSFEIELCYIKDMINKPEMVDKFKSIFENADISILAFPLYTDAMPGIVMNFIEHLDYKIGDNKILNKIGFIVHSGFPESKHSTFVTKYLKKLSTRLGREYIGTIIKGGSEGIQIRPESATKNLYNQFRRQGEYLSKNHTFDKNIINSLSKPYTLGTASKVIFKILSYLGITNFYWNKKLKENNAFNERNARPYI